MLCCSCAIYFSAAASSENIRLIPTPIKFLCRDAELDDEVAREILWLDLSPLFLPKAQESALIAAHDDPGVRATDE
jgi:hypothetical protein